MKKKWKICCNWVIYSLKQTCKMLNKESPLGLFIEHVCREEIHIADEIC